jgi:hypothetical protein
MALRFSLFTRAEAGWATVRPSKSTIVHPSATTGPIDGSSYDGPLGGAIGVAPGHCGTLPPPALVARAVHSQQASLARAKSSPRQCCALAHPLLQE